MSRSSSSSEDLRAAHEDCSVTLLTPQGRGAVAVIAVTGRAALKIVSQFFQPASGRSLAETPCGRIAFGCWRSDSESSEDVVVYRRTDSELEIHCHGGLAASQAIVEALVRTGAVEEPADAWVTRHCNESLQAQSQIALPSARTARTAGILLDQYRGSLRSALEQAVQDLANHNACSAQSRLQRILQLANVGLHLTTPWRVACAGPPNVGKSSLINRLLGYQRSIVFDEPGTTRDLLIASTAFDGWPIELIDTAGLRATSDAIESQGVARAELLLKEADLALLVFDATSPWTPGHERLVTEFPNAIAVANKQDLCPNPDWPVSVLLTSAVTGYGLENLIHAVTSRLVPAAPSQGEAVPFTSQHVAVIQRALALLEHSGEEAAVPVLQALLANSPNC